MKAIKAALLICRIPPISNRMPTAQKKTFTKGMHSEGSVMQQKFGTNG